MPVDWVASTKEVVPVLTPLITTDCNVNVVEPPFKKTKVNID